MAIGEISWCREAFLPYTKGRMTLDIGFGGAVCAAHEICMDRPEGHPERAVVPQPVPPTHLWGDARNLYWFKDGVLGCVISSHVLEDFEEGETVGVLREWLRVLEPGGYLCLFLPDQPTYVAHAKANNYLPNGAHKIAHFGLEYVRKCLAGLGVKEVEAHFPFEGNPYSFSIVVQKL